MRTFIITLFVALVVALVASTLHAQQLARFIFGTGFVQTNGNVQYQLLQYQPLSSPDPKVTSCFVQIIVTSTDSKTGAVIAQSVAATPVACPQ